MSIIETEMGLYFVVGVDSSSARMMVVVLVMMMMMIVIHVIDAMSTT